MVLRYFVPEIFFTADILTGRHFSHIVKFTREKKFNCTDEI